MNRKWVALVLAAVGLLAAVALRNSFGTGKGRDFIDPEALVAAASKGRRLGRSDGIANTPTENLKQLANDYAEIARQSGRQRLEWQLAFMTAYARAFTEEHEKAAKRGD